MPDVRDNDLDARVHAGEPNAVVKSIRLQYLERCQHQQKPTTIYIGMTQYGGLHGYCLPRTGTVEVFMGMRIKYLPMSGVMVI